METQSYAVYSETEETSFVSDWNFHRGSTFPVFLTCQKGIHVFLHMQHRVLGISRKPITRTASRDRGAGHDLNSGSSKATVDYDLFSISLWILRDSHSEITLTSAFITLHYISEHVTCTDTRVRDG